jgi:hypothetical protein
LKSLDISDPVQVGSYSGIDTSVARSTANSPGHNTNDDEGVSILDNQWDTRVTLASINVVTVSSTDHAISNVTRVVHGVTFLVADHINLDVVEDIGAAWAT